MSLPAFAEIGSASLELGSGEHVQMLRASVQQRAWRPMWQANGRHVAVHMDYSLAYWHATAFRNVAGATQNLADIGITPVLRYQRDDGLGWYAEGGIGAHVLSKRYDNRGHPFSTAFQFGDHLGVGYVFRNGWNATLKIQHFSNGGIKKPNGGENFLIAGVVRPF